ncbi:hypothetical protein IFM89_028786 [Coptis chinensis]|uniref:NPH3 domain-containing protein n=1 Tax=Coptis chinensis TaxID=261450 RepID=A0A835GZN5_9MAGN|nr:hypothetical protein IFM89_028786 [Coptis chinensis]
MVPKDWWVKDVCKLDIYFYKRVITTIKTKGRVLANVIGEALKAYALRRIPGFSKGVIQAAILLDYGDMAMRELVKRIGQQLDEASVTDLLIPTPEDTQIGIIEINVDWIFFFFTYMDVHNDSGPPLH